MSELNVTFKGEVLAQNLNALTSEHQKLIQGYGFRSHGLFVYDEAGKLLLKQPDHRVDVTAVVSFLGDYLKKRP